MTEVKRILWYYFAHDGLTHFLINMVIFFLFFSFFEKKINSLLPIIIFFLAAIFSGLSYLLIDNCSMEMSCVGSSGGIFGLMGGLLVYNFPKKIHFVPWFQYIFKSGILTIIVKILIIIIFLSELYLFIFQNICVGFAHSVHISGFLVGIIIVLIYKSYKKIK
jgi:membrane associated rhomboid family serine protease